MVCRLASPCGRGLTAGLLSNGSGHWPHDDQFMVVAGLLPGRWSMRLNYADLSPIIVKRNLARGCGGADASRKSDSKETSQTPTGRRDRSVRYVRQL